MDSSWNNTTTTLIPGYCQRDPSYQDHYLVKATLTILYSLVFIIAVSGNGLVVYVVATNKEMQSVTNFFITNLAVADLLVNFTSLWLTPCYIFLGRWVWGAVMCHLVPLFQGMSTFISALTLTAIAFDRYMVILYPFRPRMSLKCCLAVILAIWIIGAVLVAPLVVHMDLHYYEHCGEYICRERWSDPKMRVAYGFGVMGLQFGFPFLLIAYCYIRIWVFLNYRKSMINESRASNSVEEHRKKRLLKMMVCMVVIFGLCWLPVNALNVLRDTAPFDMESYFVIAFLFAHLCSMSATCWNPILYAWMNENFRREFQAVLPCFRQVTDRLRRSSSMRRGSHGTHVTSHVPEKSNFHQENVTGRTRAGSSPFLDYPNRESTLIREKNSNRLIDTPDREEWDHTDHMVDHHRQAGHVYDHSDHPDHIDHHDYPLDHSDHNRRPKLFQKGKRSTKKRTSNEADPNLNMALLATPDRNNATISTEAIGNQPRAKNGSLNGEI